MASAENDENLRSRLSRKPDCKAATVGITLNNSNDKFRLRDTFSTGAKRALAIHVLKVGPAQ